MTRIVLHPDRLPRYPAAPMLMCAPWRWWETRTHHAWQQGRDGNVYTVTFGRDGAAVTLTDPPAVRLLQITVYDDRFIEQLDRALLTSSYLLARVVWHEAPDPSWYPVPGLFTCSPGDYRFDSEMRSEQGADYRYSFGPQEQQLYMRELTWPITPTLRVNRFAGPTGTILDELAGWGGDLITTMQNAYTPNEIREREGLQPVQIPRYWNPQPSIVTGGRRPNVLPESEVIAEIDRLEEYFDTRDEAEAAVRLVNDQVRRGPRDDYNADRYPKCADCGHTWHGLDCEHCGCLNTDWLKS
jgi:hypothetical protein